MDEDEVYFVLSWSEGITFRVETCESTFLVDGCHESVVLITRDKNVQKRSCIVLFNVVRINSCLKFQRLLLKMYVEYIRNVKS